MLEVFEECLFSFLKPIEYELHLTTVTIATVPNRDMLTLGSSEDGYFTSFFIFLKVLAFGKCLSAKQLVIVPR